MQKVLNVYKMLLTIQLQSSLKCTLVALKKLSEKNVINSTHYPVRHLSTLNSTVYIVYSTTHEDPDSLENYKLVFKDGSNLKCRNTLAFFTVLTRAYIV